MSRLHRLPGTLRRLSERPPPWYVSEDMDRNKTTESSRKRFDPLARPFEWYRLPLAIKLAFMQLWRREQEGPTQRPVRTKDAKDR